MLFDVALYTALAVAATVIGVALVGATGRVPLWVMGWANALAAGLMLGASYLLIFEAMTLGPATASTGTVLGIAFIYVTHRLLHLAEVDLSDPDLRPPSSAGAIISRVGLHSAAEGIAIGAAFLVDFELGIFFAGAIAIHNIPEGAAMAVGLAVHGAGPRRRIGWSVVAKSTQLVAALVTVVITGAAPALLSGVLGFSTGAMFYLVMVELLPESYRQRGQTGIAVLAIVAMSATVLFKSLFTGS